MTQRVVEKGRYLSGGRRDRLCLADTRRQPPIEGAQRGLCAAHCHCSEPQQRRRPAAGASRSGREDLAARYLVVGRQAEPGSEVLGIRPSREISAALADEFEGKCWPATETRDVMPPWTKFVRIQPRGSLVNCLCSTQS